MNSDQLSSVRSALLSVYHKEGLDALLAPLQELGITIISTGGTARHIKELGIAVTEVEELTGYPSILGGRVKTLHPKVHGGILARRGNAQDEEEMATYDISAIDLVVVDLYPFEETVAKGRSTEEIIEKIDIGGIALIRAAAKNFQHVACIPSRKYYDKVATWLVGQQGKLTLGQRKELAAAAFDVSSHYDGHIYSYLSEGNAASIKESHQQVTPLRYGENPHQWGKFYGDLSQYFDQLQGKALSYNNLVDLEAAVRLTQEFTAPCFSIIKHTNPCGCALGDSIIEAWHKALAGDPVSAFGGILCTNGEVTEEVAKEIDKLFFEVLVAPSFTEEALTILQKKKKRVLLKQLAAVESPYQGRKLLGGFLVQQEDNKYATPESIEVKTSRKATDVEVRDALFGEIICKHMKSNAITLVKNGQLIGGGVGQTSRIDAVNQAIDKAERMGFETKGAVLISDAFFPFADSVEIAQKKGIEVVVQPGGSIRDNETINFCENHDMCLIFTGLRHFKH
ncbi:MAG: bifunctional phosphoribosylaminoimidazolecarboxamide formyltransferase/IMP cyclohydrolase [Bacteroidota bacterium]